MDFLAVPFVFVFILPTLSAYSTNLNIIFFYMTWTTLVLSYNARRVELFGTLAARFVCYFFPSFFFFLFDFLMPETAARFKARGEEGLPSGNKKGSVTQNELKIVAWSYFNFTLSLVLQMVIETYLTVMPGLWPAVRVWLTVPLPWDIVKHLFWAFSIREILIYYIHRYILHSPRDAPTSSGLTDYIANLHTTWYHKSLGTPFPLAAHYDHPVCYILGTFLPMYIPVFWLQMHMLTFLFFTTIISLEDLFAFSGYEVLPNFLGLEGVGTRLGRHLESGGKIYFGRWGVWDVIRGTGELEEGSLRGRGR
ncbi:hypothetical protein BJY04DRAFT_213303 [Aspergillus karnatakaensis]|uniref:uncharacterized protein n=1 Tax=Aspergillus karnatakaensis TaxID=1810916 RepID=UPI003CCDCBC0